MTYQEIHGLVSHGEKLPPFQSLPDKLCYECLSSLKRQYEQAGIDERRLRVGKQVVRRSHEEYTRAFRQYMAVYKEYNDNCLKTGQAMKAIWDGLNEERPDYQALFLMAIDCIGRMQHDESVVRMVREKMRGVKVKPNE